MWRNSCRVRPVVWHTGYRIHSILVSRFPVHRVRWSRFCSLQRHSGRQVFNTGTQLPDPRRNDSQPRRHLPDTRQTIVAVVLLVSPAAWTQFRHDLCFTADKNESHRPHPRRLEEALSDQEASVHVRCSSGVYLEPDFSHVISVCRSIVVTHIHTWIHHNRNIWWRYFTVMHVGLKGTLVLRNIHVSCCLS